MHSPHITSQNSDNSPDINVVIYLQKVTGIFFFGLKVSTQPWVLGVFFGGGPTKKHLRTRQLRGLSSYV